MYAGSLSRRRAKARPNTKKPTAARMTVNAHDADEIMGECKERNSASGASSSTTGLGMGTVVTTTPASTKITQARASVTLADVSASTAAPPPPATEPPIRLSRAKRELADTS